MMKDRILKFINKEGISPAHFADEIGVQRSSVSHILSGRNNPSFDFIYKILQRYKNISAEWLITGVGEIYKKNDKITVIPDSKPKENGPVQRDLFSNPVTADHPKINIQEMIQEPVLNKTVEKIIVFYSDKTFTEFKPSS